MTVKSGGAWAGTFVTLDATGALATPSTGPAGVLYVDGVANGAAVTISGANPYKWSVTLPALTAGQRVDMYITATIATIATAGFVASDQADTVLVSEVKAETALILADTGTDGVKIAADAITASTFDESTAFPIKSADTGATQIARVGADSDTLETLSDQMDAIDADVWSYAARTLTQSAASVAAVLAGSNITIQRGDTETINLTDIGVLTGYSKIWFTAKDSKYVSDTESILQIEKTDGLLHLNKLPAIAATDGSITISDEAIGNISVVIKAAATAVLMPGIYYYDIQLLSSTGVVSTLTSGRIIIEADITRSIE